MTTEPSRLLLDLLNSDAPNYAVTDRMEKEGYPVATAYLITGQTGAYSDKRHWYVAAFLRYQDAAGYLIKLERWAIEQDMVQDKDGWWNFESQRGELDTWELRDLLQEAGCPLDPNFKIDYNGVKWTVAKLPLKGDR